MQVRLNFSRFLFLPISIFFLILLVSTCTNDSVTSADLETICFDSAVYPILYNNCASCHESGGGGFSVQSYSTIVSQVVPYEPRKSVLYKVITSINGETMMPPDHPLSQVQRNIIQVWIEQGARQTQCSVINPPDSIPDVDTNKYADSVCFTQDILPLFQSSCASTGCHDAGSHKEGLVLTNYSSIMKGIKAYNPSESKYYKVTTYTNSEDRMPPPPKSPLSSDQKAILYKWISEGALNSNCPDESCDTNRTISFSEQVFPLIDKYCVACHTSGFENGGINLENYANIKSVALTQQNTISLLKGCLRGMSGFKQMPPTGKLDECKLRIIEIWIDQGVQQN